MLDQGMMAQANREFVDLVNPNVRTTQTRVRDLTTINTFEFYGSKVEENPQVFIDELYKILMTIGVTPVENS